VAGAYAASKAGLNRVSETLRIELAPFGVTVLTVIIGGAATEFITNEAPRAIPKGSRYAPIGDEILHWAKDKGGLKNMMTPEQLADGLVGRVVVPGKGGTVWIGSIATLMRVFSFGAPQWLMVSGAAVVDARY
jgi:NAD(P)-dependent dehydrogenase (short-subunit alcohol dehydrogenase family)